LLQWPAAARPESGKQTDEKTKPLPAGEVFNRPRFICYFAGPPPPRG